MLVTGCGVSGVHVAGVGGCAPGDVGGWVGEFWILVSIILITMSTCRVSSGKSAMQLLSRLFSR